jgi:hypothetical protein
MVLTDIKFNQYAVETPISNVIELHQVVLCMKLGRGHMSSSYQEKYVDPNSEISGSTEAKKMDTTAYNRIVMEQQPSET